MNINDTIEEQLESIYDEVSKCTNYVFTRPKRYPYTKEQWAPLTLEYHCDDFKYVENLYVNIHTKYVINSGVIYGK